MFGATSAFGAAGATTASNTKVGAQIDTDGGATSAVGAAGATTASNTKVGAQIDTGAGATSAGGAAGDTTASNTKVGAQIDTGGGATSAVGAAGATTASNTKVGAQRKLGVNPAGADTGVGSLGAAGGVRANTAVGVEADTGGGADLLFHVGDLSYATGHEAEWDRFMEQIEPLSARLPYLTAQGNHERDYPSSGSAIGVGDSGGECGVPTQSRFHMPTCERPNTQPCVSSPRPASHVELSIDAPGPVPASPADDGWYSLSQASCHFLVLNTEMPSSNGSRQFSFVEADLAAVDRRLTPWVVVLGHRQMYSGDAMTPQNGLADLEPLLFRYHVDLAVWGHMHYAQASCPLYHGRCVTHTDAAGYDAPIHLVVGNAGQPLDPLPVSLAPWSRWAESSWGFAHLRIANATHLDVDFWRDAPLDRDATLAHTLRLTRSFPRVET